jgi:hypothetical protein
VLVTKANKRDPAPSSPRHDFSFPMQRVADPLRRRFLFQSKTLRKIAHKILILLLNQNVCAMLFVVRRGEEFKSSTFYEQIRLEI